MTGGRDERIIKSVEDIYNIIDEDRKNGEYYIYVVPKAAREGATTSFGSVAINRDMAITLVEPTNSIATDTIGTDSIKYSDHPDTKMHYVYSNKHCLIIGDMILKTPGLKELPYILIPKRCPDCDNYKNCQYSEVLREELPITAVNYSKITYVIAGSEGDESVSSLILSKLMLSKVFVFDEIHYMQNLSPIIVPISFYKKNNDQQYDMFGFDKYRVNISEKYNNIHKVLNIFERITKHNTINQSCQKVLSEALSDNYYEKHISEPLKNPCRAKSKRLPSKFAVEMCEMVKEEGYGKLDVKIDLVPLYDF